MNEERMLILRMIQEGKVTAEEGAALLEALETSSAEDGGPEKKETNTESPKEEKDIKGYGSIYSGPGESGSHERDRGEQSDAHSWTERIEKEASRFARDIEEAVGKLGDTIEERLEKDVKPALANLPNILSQIPILANWTGPFVNVEREITGEFADSAVEVELMTRNGTIDVESWDEPSYKVVLQCKVRGKSEIEGHERLGKLLTVDQRPGKLLVQHPTISGESVSITAYLPKGREYKCLVRTDNGRIRVRGLKGTLFSSKTANGAITLEELSGTWIRAKTANGNVDFQAIEASEAEAATANGHIHMKGGVTRAKLRTVNGIIRVRPLVQLLPSGVNELLYDLNTVNGGITVELPSPLKTACHLDLQTQFSNINVAIDGLEYELNEKKAGHNRIVARGHKFGDSERRIGISARTVSGGLTVLGFE